MKEFESPTYYLDLKDRGTRTRIEGAKVGQTVKVLVRAAEDPVATPITATGTRKDPKEFVVEVVTDTGKQTHTRDREELATDIAAAEK